MTPGQARMALLCFAALLIGVAANALYLQKSPLPSGAVVQGAAGPAERVKPSEAKGASRTTPRTSAAPNTLRIARFAPDAKRNSQPPAAGADGETTRALQRELKARGYGPLPTNGSADLATRSAIMAYEHDQGLALTGMPSEALLKRVLLGASLGAQDPGSGEVASGEAEAVVVSVQQSLSALGYRPGPADGRLSEETKRAIHDFELDQGMVPKGRISSELIARLKAPER